MFLLAETSERHKNGSQINKIHISMSLAIFLFFGAFFLFFLPFSHSRCSGFLFLGSFLLFALITRLRVFFVTKRKYFTIIITFLLLLIWNDCHSIRRLWAWFNNNVYTTMYMYISRLSQSNICYAYKNVNDEEQLNKRKPFSLIRIEYLMNGTIPIDNSAEDS